MNQLLDARNYREVTSSIVIFITKSSLETILLISKQKVEFQ